MENMKRLILSALRRQLHPVSRAALVSDIANYEGYVMVSPEFQRYFGRAFNNLRDSGQVRLASVRSDGTHLYVINE